MPIAVKRGIIEETAIVNNNITDEEIANDAQDCVDVNGLHYSLPYYNIYVFRNPVPVILFYLKDGFTAAMDFLGVSGAINLVEKVPTEQNNNLYFEISRNRCYIEVNKTLFHKHAYLQSIVGGILHVSNARNTIDSFDKPEVWIKKLSTTNNLEKGYDILNFFGRMMDETTRKNVKIHQYHRQDIYTILRWMCQEFTTLRLKDNLSLDNKRLRCNEVISSLLTLEFSRRLNRILSLGEKATIDNYRELFKFPGDILIQKMHEPNHKCVHLKPL
jgi:hypothetical protein